MTEKDQSKEILGQPLSVRIASWIDAHSQPYRDALEELWKKRKVPDVLDSLGEYSSSEIADAVRSWIQSLQRDLHCEFCELMSSIHLSLCALRDPPQNKPL
ncbi:MAG: hypothetical protein PHE68_03040 [Candidatus Peribacteraceae bacterium]|nr:hypothetical protein [Candidatus Peribacteraceae bacterium]MDD5074257.1 hypothetical protein [Candidatus Peribacteraceae bacterium]